MRNAPIVSQLAVQFIVKFMVDIEAKELEMSPAKPSFPSRYSRSEGRSKCHFPLVVGLAQFLSVHQSMFKMNFPMLIVIDDSFTRFIIRLNHS